MSPVAAPRRATVDDLAKVDGKAELIDGRLVHQMATGYRPGVIGGRIFRRLADWADAADGEAFVDNIGFVIPELASGRESFSPDAAYYTGPLPSNPMKFIPGPPTFAVEVRSENDYGLAAERAMASKRADYFEAGTLVVWDVDPMAMTIRRFRPNETEPTTFKAGDVADAEPAVPGWRLSVDSLMK